MKNEERIVNQTSWKLTVIPVVLGFLLLPAIIFGVFKLVFWINQDTLKTYQQLMTDTGLKKDDLKKTPYQISQHRFNVQKDIRFIKNENPMQLRLLADNAQMIFDHHDFKTEMIEHMNLVVCCMQEELYYILPSGEEVIFSDDGKLVLRNQNENNEKRIISKEKDRLKPMQIMRFMTADLGTYYYKTDSFYANHVKIERFLVEGHEFSEAPLHKKKLMSGIAESAEFSLKGKSLEFKATKLKATFYQPKS